MTINDVAVDARGTSQSVAVQLLGNHGRLTGSVVFGGGEAGRIGVGVGYAQTVVGVEVDHDRVSGFGLDSDKDHGVYVVNAVGVLVHDNYIFDNSGYGIHLWTHSLAAASTTTRSTGTAPAASSSEASGTRTAARRPTTPSMPTSSRTRARAKTSSPSGAPPARPAQATWCPTTASGKDRWWRLRACRTPRTSLPIRRTSTARRGCTSSRRVADVPVTASAWPARP